MYYEKKPESISRWRITGRIRTGSPLHIGDGTTSPIGNRACQKAFLDEGRDPLYSMVMTTRAQRPVIPGTSLKGALHAWASAHLARTEAALILETFGSQDSGGIVSFHDAELKSVTQPDNPAYQMWCESRSTSLTPQVVINPRTRSAEEGLLYYIEFVPSGAEFEVSLTAQGGSSRHRALLLYLLRNAFQSVYRPARLGSESANGWGRVTWLAAKAKYEVMDLGKWLSEPAMPWYKSLLEIDSATRTQWLAETSAFAAPAADKTITLSLTLDFDGRMLINDPSRQKKASAGGRKSSGESIGHAMIRDHAGAVYLPAQSVRGAFRAQARRIWQTVFHDHESQDLNRSRRTEARRSRSQKQLAAFLKLFGATGWRAPVEIGDFKLESGGADYEQEFVAVDRFTGGVAGSRKFNAHGILRPRFSGTISVRTDRLFSPPEVTPAEDQSAEAGPWVWMILAWTLRDWAEGDGSIGFGRSKGYGTFRASISSAAGGPEAALLQRILRRDSAALTSPEVLAWQRSLNQLFEHREAA